MRWRYHFALSLAGKHAGEMEWVLEPQGPRLSLEARSFFGGPLPERQIWQHSVMDASTLESLLYREGEGRGRPQFSVYPDHDAGLLRLEQRGEKAQQPLLTAHHDPLSLLWWLASLQPSAGKARLSGGWVWYSPLWPSEGSEEVRYLLRPEAELWARLRDKEGKQPQVVRPQIVQLRQPTEAGPLLAESTD